MQQTRRVALAVPALVVVEHRLAGGVGQVLQTLQNFHAPDRMLHDHVELVGGERAALAQDVLGHPGLAHVVQGGAPAHGLELLTAQAVGLAQPHGVRDHPHHMLTLHRVQGGAQAADGLLQGVLGAAQPLAALVGDFGRRARQFQVSGGQLLAALPDHPHPLHDAAASDRAFLADAGFGVQALGMAALRQFQELIQGTAHHLFTAQAGNRLPVAADPHDGAGFVEQEQGRRLGRQQRGVVGLKLGLRLGDELARRRRNLFAGVMVGIVEGEAAKGTVQAPPRSRAGLRPSCPGPASVRPRKNL